MTEKKLELLYSRAEIAERIEALGAEISQRHAGRELTVVGPMRNCLVFMADLIRAVSLPAECHFLQSSILREAGAVSTGIVYTAEVPFAGRHVLLLNDVVDTGVTLSFLRDHIDEQRPASLDVCALVDKPSERKVAAHPDLAAFTLKEPFDRFIVGYGLDYRERYRGLPYLASIDVPPRAAVERREGESVQTQSPAATGPGGDSK
jgi:hypoxanthine phosphoribosyltransferase